MRTFRSSVPAPAILTGVQGAGAFLPREPHDRAGQALLLAGHSVPRNTFTRDSDGYDRIAEWAAQVGVACGPLNSDKKDDMIHELDAVVAHPYGLSEKHLIHIFETFREGWAYSRNPKALSEVEFLRDEVTTRTFDAASQPTSGGPPAGWKRCGTTKGTLT